MIYLVLFIIGTIMGSFYTVIGLRRPKNESIIKPRSHCENCGHTLNFYELVPIISYIFLGGKCLKCKHKLSLIYPIIELLCGLLFALSFYIFGISYDMLIMLCLSSLAIIIFVSDFNYYVILDGPLIIFGILITILIYLSLGLKEMIFHVLSGLSLLLFMIIVKIIGNKIFKRESLGGGDIKLAFIMGLTLGFSLSFISLIMATFLAFPYALYVSWMKDNEEMPFGPFLVSALVIVFILSDFLTSFLNVLI